MSRGAATLAIARSRLQRDVSLTFAFSAIAACVAYFQRYDEPLAHLAGALVFGTIAAGAAALSVPAWRHHDLTLCEEAAPLYGRELARARAIAPATSALCALAAYWIVAALYGPQPLAFVVESAAASAAAGIAALCATRERAYGRIAYAGVAAALCAAVFLFSEIPAAALALCAAAAFVLLRQYGERLARS